ncbi:cysteine proteinase inhibitor [Trifolium repens]|nr:cysteine proteinase inhibitor [Trifolium repens]
MRFQSVVVIFVVLFALVATNEAHLSAKFHPINITDPYVIGLANFAVTEYNKQITTTTKLKFEKLIYGESQFLLMGVGRYYRLTLPANNGSASNNYRADVMVRPLLHFKGLISFEKLDA